MTDEEQTAIDLQSEAEAAASEEKKVTSEPVVDKEPAKPAVPVGVQKRIDQITRQKHDAERRVEELEQRLNTTSQQQIAPAGKPKLEDFDYDDAKYIDALTDWKVGNALDTRQKQDTERQQQQTARQTAQNFESKREQVIAEGIAAYEDFEEKTLNNPNLVITQDMANVLTESELGRDVFYYLGNNAEESRRIAGLTPMNQARELGMIEAGLKMKPKKKVTSAPEPIQAVGARGATSANIDPSKDYKAWARARNEGKI